MCMEICTFTTYVYGNITFATYVWKYYIIEYVVSGEIQQSEVFSIEFFKVSTFFSTVQVLFDSSSKSVVLGNQSSFRRVREREKKI